MSFNPNELILEKIRAVEEYDPATKELTGRYTQIEEPSLKTSAEGTQVPRLLLLSQLRVGESHTIHREADQCNMHFLHRAPERHGHPRKKSSWRTCCRLTPSPSLPPSLSPI